LNINKNLVIKYRKMSTTAAAAAAAGKSNTKLYVGIGVAVFCCVVCIIGVTLAVIYWPSSSGATGATGAAPPPLPPTPPPNPLSSFTTMNNIDYPGNDIGQTSGDTAAVATTCLANPACLGFNSSGWMKNKVTGTGTSQKGVTFYKRN
jgi:hypothetical protein